VNFLAYLEQTGFSIWVRESRSLFSYPGILLLHTYGMAIVVGLIAGIDLRILGFAPALPLAPMRKLLPIMWAAFWVNAVTGTILMVVDATTKLRNPDFFIKMGLILVAVVIQRLIEKRVFPGGEVGEVGPVEAPLTTNVKMLALASLVCWLGAITAGRLLAYVGPVSGL
jgi:hypothetical protein